MGTAMLAEALGTFLLVLLILVLTDGCNVAGPRTAQLLCSSALP